MLCDELYSVFCAIDIPKNLDEKKVHIACALVLQSYWVGLSTLFALLGAVIPFDLTGVDFALTALFMVILIEMFIAGETKLPAICACVIGVICLVIFGPNNFMIPALIIVTASLVLLKRVIKHRKRRV